MKMSEKIKRINFTKLAYLLLILILIISFLAKKNLPGQDKILPELYNEPIQTDADEPRFSFAYRDIKYSVIPKADYELWGLVVTHNNINSLFNYYHDKDSVNLKDICVVWGDNIKSGVYRDIKFRSGEFTCYPGSIFGKSKKVYEKYKNNKISNNHLLASNEEIQNTIRKLRLGDQVYVRGLLVNYGRTGLPEKYFRGTSLTRDDTGKGACETIFVKEIIILKRSGEIWYLLYKWSIILMIILTLWKFLFFVVKIFRGKNNLR